MTHKVVYRMKLVGDAALVSVLSPYLAQYVAASELTLRRAREFKAALELVFAGKVAVKTVSIPTDVKDVS